MFYVFFSKIRKEFVEEEAELSGVYTVALLDCSCCLMLLLLLYISLSLYGELAFRL